jgi:hypothetical protein
MVTKKDKAEELKDKLYDQKLINLSLRMNKEIKALSLAMDNTKESLEQFHEKIDVILQYQMICPIKDIKEQYIEDKRLFSFVRGVLRGEKLNTFVFITTVTAWMMLVSYSSIKLYNELNTSSNPIIKYNQKTELVQSEINKQ